MLARDNRGLAYSEPIGVAPHSNSDFNLDWDVDARAGDLIFVEVVVGGGGGHKLHLSATLVLDVVPEGTDGSFTGQSHDNVEFRWGSRVRGELINISSDGLTATDIARNPTKGDHVNGRYRVVAAERGYSSGEHVIRLKVLKRGRFLFGLATGDVQSNWHEGNGKSLHQVKCAWTICVPSTGGQGFNKWHANQHEETGLLPWPDDPEGQMITMTLNCDAGTVGFAVNDDCGSNASFSGLPRGTALFPVVSFGGDGSAGCSVHVQVALSHAHCFEQLTDNLQ